MIKKNLLTLVTVLFALLGLYFVYNYFTQPIIKAPTINNFRGPTGAPYIKGPSGPPPGENQN